MEKQQREAEIKQLEAEERERQQDRELRELMERMEKMMTAEAEQKSDEITKEKQGKQISQPKAVMFSEFHKQPTDGSKISTVSLNSTLLCKLNIPMDFFLLILEFRLILQLPSFKTVMFVDVCGNIK